MLNDNKQTKETNNIKKIPNIKIKNHKIEIT
jgi:hypothetical protein